MEPFESKYANKPLQLFVETMIQDHYNIVEILCRNAQQQMDKVRSLETGSEISQYTLLCSNIVNETRQYIDVRKEKYIPYVLTLSEKSTENHDCSTCSGNCKLNHDMQLLELRASNDLMQKMIKKLHIASLPLYSETMYPEEYRLLRNHMSLIETNLMELFFLENNYLIPKIIVAQKSINASDH